MSSTCKRCTRRKPRNLAHINTKVHVAVNDNGLPVKALITSGTVTDCSKAIELIDGLEGDIVIADKGYDSTEIVEFVEESGMKSVIPPRKNRLQQRYYDKWLYKRRHLVENFFLKLKQWRGIACRYVKNTTSFQAMLNLVFAVIWSKHV